MVSLGHICIDGTELKELIQRELVEGIKVDEAENEIYGDSAFI